MSIREIVKQVFATQHLNRDQELMIQRALCEPRLREEETEALNELLTAMSAGGIQHWSRQA
jgi:hypothetical protein